MPATHTSTQHNPDIIAESFQKTLYKILAKGLRVKAPEWDCSQMRIYPCTKSVAAALEQLTFRRTRMTVEGSFRYYAIMAEAPCAK